MRVRAPSVKQIQVPRYVRCGTNEMGVAQMVEQRLPTPKAGGSNPSTHANNPNKGDGDA